MSLLLRDFGFDNRLIAGLTWNLIILGGAYIVLPGVRGSYHRLAAILFKVLRAKNFMLPAVALSAYVFLEVGIGKIAGLWEPRMLATTLLWTVGIGGGMLSNHRAVTDLSYAVRVVGLSSVLVVWLVLLFNAHVFSFAIEVLVVMPSLLGSMYVAAMGVRVKESHPLRSRIMGWLVLLIIFVVVAAALYELFGNLGEILTWRGLEPVLVPLSLTIGLVPFLLAFTRFHRHIAA